MEERSPSPVEVKGTDSSTVSQAPSSRQSVCEELIDGVIDSGATNTKQVFCTSTSNRAEVAD